MSINRETYEQIDRYLMNEMSQEENRAFKLQVESDPELEKAVESQQEMIDLMEEQDNIVKLRKKLDGFHQNIDMSEARKRIKQPKSERRKANIRMFVNLAVAASVSLIVALSVMKYSRVFENNKSELELLINDMEDLSQKQDRMEDEFAKEKASKIIKEEPKPNYNGTGFVISSNGYLVTNYHVVQNIDSIFISHQLDTVTRYKVRPVYGDRKNDLAILLVDDPEFKSFGRIPYTFSTKESGLSEYVFTLDYSKGDIVFGEGNISSHTGYMGDTTAYQVSIPANPGISGAPLIDAYGRIIGIVTGKNSKKESAAFAIRSEYFLSIIDSIRNDTSFEKPVIPRKNRISWMKRPEQIKKLRPFVYKVEVYKK